MVDSFREWHDLKGYQKNILWIEKREELWSVYVRNREAFLQQKAVLNNTHYWPTPMTRLKFNNENTKAH